MVNCKKLGFYTFRICKTGKGIKKNQFSWFNLTSLGRDTGVEPVHVRFTAGCVHRFTNRATARIIYSVNGSTSTLFCSNSNQF